MKKIIFIFCMLFFNITAISALKVTLKENHEVKKEFLTLSDFFNDIPQERDQEILEAPGHGEVKHYPHAWVRRLAQNFGLYWSPTHYKGITLARQEYAVKHFDVQKVIKEYISQNYSDKVSDTIDVALEITPFAQRRAMGDADPKLINFSWLDTYRFVATFDMGGKETKIKGAMAEMIYIPVLNKSLQPGNIIQKEDIEYKAFPQHKVTAHTIQNEQDLVGKTVKRSIIQVGNALRTQDITSPIIIKRGDLVTMRVEGSGVLITAKGKAQGNAAAGQIVQVMNLESKRLIEGIAKDSQIVVIPIATR